MTFTRYYWQLELDGELRPPAATSCPAAPRPEVRGAAFTIRGES